MRDGCTVPCLKWGSLCVVLVQNTALYLTAHASLGEPGSPAYLGSVAVLITEVLKAAVSVVSAAAESGPCVMLGDLRHLLVRDPYWTAKFALPALSYSIHNNLWYVAVANLDPMLIAVTAQFKIVFAALFARLLLGHKLSFLRQGAIALLIVGLSLLQGRGPITSATPRHRGDGGGPRAFEPDQARGLLAMAGVCALSGFAGTFTEVLLKDDSRAVTLWMRNVQMAAFSTPMAAVTMLLLDGGTLRAQGPWVGFNSWLACTIVLGVSSCTAPSGSCSCALAPMTMPCALALLALSAVCGPPSPRVPACWSMAPPVASARMHRPSRLAVS